MKKNTLIALPIAVLIGFLATPFCQADDSPTGLWKSRDDKSGKPKALIRITETSGELNGKIEKLYLDETEEKNPKCDKCSGPNKDQAIIGMTILFGLKKDGEEYSGGKILDPANGKLYSSKLSVADHNRKLNVRGYIGVPFMGRTQTWLREQ